MSSLTGSEPCPKCRVLLNWQAHIADRYIPNARVLPVFTIPDSNSDILWATQLSANTDSKIKLEITCPYCGTVINFWGN